MRRNLYTTASIIALYLLCSCSHAGHDHQHDDNHDHEIHASEEHDHDHDHDHDQEDDGNSDKGDNHSNEIVFSHDKAKAAGVVTERIMPGNFSEVIATSGRILPSAGDESTVAATRSGIIKMSRPWAVGMQVSAGASLFAISASKLPDGDPAAKAKVEYAKAKAEFERAEALYKEHLLTATEYQNAKAAMENARIVAQASGADNASGGVITAPRSGYVTECLVKDGEFVEVGTPLMTISTNRRLRLQADLPQREYSKLSSIRSANFRLSQSDDVISLKDLNGRVVSHGRSTDASGAFIPVIFEFDNAAGIPSGVFTEVYLIGAPREGVISVPKSALVEDQGVFYIFVREDEDCYTRHSVVTGRSDGKNVEIISGLNGGENVVVKGAIHVKLASASKAIPGHTHNH